MSKLRVTIVELDGSCWSYYFDTLRSYNKVIKESLDQYLQDTKKSNPTGDYKRIEIEYV